MSNLQHVVIGLDEVIRKAETIRLGQGEFIHDSIVSSIYTEAATLAGEVVKKPASRKDFDSRIDNLVTSRIFGYPLMLVMLGGIFWLTLVGSNYPGELLAGFLFSLEEVLGGFMLRAGAPAWLHGVLVSGVYRSLAWVVSVMLPPMAIFFPLFTLLEDLGYLPRVAFNLDRAFRRVGAHGKQVLTMSMGFGCNAAGVIAARVIDSPRERLIAILTNAFVPCNGRFPALIAIAVIFMAGGAVTTTGSAVAAAVVAGLVVVGIAMTLLVSLFLSRTLLKGEPSSFSLELPPYRKPEILTVIVRSIFDRTIFVLGRAVMVAAPAGAITWIFANIMVGEASVLSHFAGWLEPFGRAIGVDGVIIMALLLGLPANEIVVPIMVMSYLAVGSMLEPDSLEALRSVLVTHGWNWLTALNFMLLMLLHFPCGTTLLTIKRETGRWRWTVLGALIPTAVGVILCFIIATSARLLGLI